MTDHGPFVFDSYAFDAQKGTLDLRYKYRNGPAFQESYSFPPSARALNEADRHALENAARLLFLLAGVSYYKAYAPKTLECDAFPLDAASAAFVEKVYRNGLGEFAYKNKLDLRDRVHFAADKNAAAPKAEKLDLARHHLVPVGGGKDSIVTLDCLSRMGLPVTLFALAPASGIAEPIRATVEAARLPSVTVTRRLSPNMAEVNAAGAYNGHVPITAILSVAAVITAILSGADAVVLSNEHSADAPNLVHDGVAVNHQYSKSSEFEADLSAYLHSHVSPDIRYFSFLRPLTEAAITRRFAKLDHYHPVFRSCNANFRQDVTKRGAGWCCDCPKCRFVFLALAPFMEKDRLAAIFGKNMLDDPKQTEGFAALCGVFAHKPFECVGETAESALLMLKLSQSPAWKNDAVVAALGPKVALPSKEFETKYAELFVLKNPHYLTKPYVEALHACG